MQQTNARTKQFGTRVRLAVTGVAVLLLLTLAASPAVGGQISVTVTVPQQAESTPDDGSRPGFPLPRTGADILLFALAGLGLVLAGTVATRVARRGEDER